MQIVEFISFIPQPLRVPIGIKSLKKASSVPHLIWATTGDTDKSWQTVGRKKCTLGSAWFEVCSQLSGSRKSTASLKMIPSIWHVGNRLPPEIKQDFSSDEYLDIIYHSFVCQSEPALMPMNYNWPTKIVQPSTIYAWGWMSAVDYMELRHVFRVPDQEILYTTSTVIFPWMRLHHPWNCSKCQHTTSLTTEEWRLYLCSRDDGNPITWLQGTYKSKPVPTAIHNRYILLGFRQN